MSTDARGGHLGGVHFRGSNTLLYPPSRLHMSRGVQGQALAMPMRSVDTSMSEWQGRHRGARQCGWKGYP